jgi:hypothetical protein
MMALGEGVVYVQWWDPAHAPPERGDLTENGLMRAIRPPKFHLDATKQGALSTIPTLSPPNLNTNVTHIHEGFHKHQASKTRSWIRYFMLDATGKG